MSVRPTTQISMPGPANSSHEPFFPGHLALAELRPLDALEHSAEFELLLDSVGPGLTPPIRSQFCLLQERRLSSVLNIGPRNQLKQERNDQLWYHAGRGVQGAVQGGG